MGWLSKIFGKGVESEKPMTMTSGLKFVKLQDAVSLKPKVTSWIRSQKSHSGALMWFKYPYDKNKTYEPCFGILTDPVLFAKLERATSFDLACGLCKSPSSFQWRIAFEDPLEPGVQITLLTEPIRVDESSLEMLCYAAQELRVHYLFYASAESSNFVFMEMFPEFNKKLFDFYSSLHKTLTGSSKGLEQKEPENEPSFTLIGPSTPLPVNSKKDQSKGGPAGISHLGETTLELADGTVIQLADIKEISNGRQVVGASNHPIIEAIRAELAQGRGVIYLLHVSKNGPATAVIPVTDQATAIALIGRINGARAALKQRGSARVIVGECSECHRQLRVKEYAIKPDMVLTCKCGQINKVHVSSEVLGK